MELTDRLPFIYDVATSEKNWTSALDHFGAAANAKGIVLYASNNSSFTFNIVQTNSFYQSHPEAVVQYFNQYSKYDSISVSYVYSNQPFQMVEDIEVFGRNTIFDGRDDVEFLKREFGIYRRSAVNISKEPGWDALVATHFDAEILKPQAQWYKNACFLATHLSKAIEINRFCTQLRQRYQAVLTALNHIDIALCVALPTGEILVQNTRARQIFDEANGLRLTSENFLKLRNEEQTAAIQAYITECAGTAAGRSDRVERIVKASKQTLDEPYLIEISPLRDGDDELNEKLEGALVLIIDPQNPPILSVVQLAKLFNLTPAETAVTKLLLQGRTLPEIAETRNVSNATVRNQAKAIYAKVGITNRAELIRKIANVSPPIIGSP